jgi:hypothetical protein
MSTVLEREIETYEQHKEELVGTAAGKYVLIKEDVLVGVFDTQADAIRQGYRQFGNTPFLVKEVVPLETPLVFTSNLFGI